MEALKLDWFLYVSVAHGGEIHAIAESQGVHHLSVFQRGTSIKLILEILQKTEDGWEALRDRTTKIILDRSDPP